MLAFFVEGESRRDITDGFVDLSQFENGLWILLKEDHTMVHFNCFVVLVLDFELASLVQFFIDALGDDFGLGREFHFVIYKRSNIYTFILFKNHHQLSESLSNDDSSDLSSSCCMPLFCWFFCSIRLNFDCTYLCNCRILLVGRFYMFSYSLWGGWPS